MSALLVRAGQYQLFGQRLRAFLRPLGSIARKQNGRAALPAMNAEIPSGVGLGPVKKNIHDVDRPFYVVRDPSARVFRPFVSATFIANEANAKVTTQIKPTIPTQPKSLNSAQKRRRMPFLSGAGTSRNILIPPVLPVATGLLGKDFNADRQFKRLNGQGFFLGFEHGRERTVQEKNRKTSRDVRVVDSLLDSNTISTGNRTAQPRARSIDAFVRAKAGMTMGWTGSFDKLEDLLETRRTL